jgi:hypothetical protein
VAQLEQQAGVWCGGWSHGVATFVSFGLVCALVASMRMRAFKMNGDVAFFASWLGIFLSMLQLMFTRINFTGSQQEPAGGSLQNQDYKLVNTVDDCDE